MEKITCPKCQYQWEQSSESIYWQRNPRYKGYKLGKSNTSMQQYGCYLMCLSYLSGKDPIEVDELFMKNDVYKDTDNIPDFNFADDDIIDSKKASKILGFSNYVKVTDVNRMPVQELSIKEVTLGKGQHFTVRIFRDNKRLIFDPWEGKELPINQYKFRSYRIFEK